MLNQTPLYDLHKKANAKLVNFAGWEMPLHYGSQITEHHAVRQNAGIFDVSHMGVIDLKGDNVQIFLLQLLANNIQKINPGRALYTCMLNDKGGVIDDLIVYQIDSTWYRIIVNAGTREKDLAWIKKHSIAFDLNIIERTDLCILALQGPKAVHILQKILGAEDFAKVSTLKTFQFMHFNDWFIARTGYTGEDGFELILPKNLAREFWLKALNLGAIACGLGARDTLRLEAGLNLYGSDMNEDITPLEANLTWTVAFEPKERMFIGREALEQEMQKGVKCRLTGVVLEGPGIIRNHQKVYDTNNIIGEVTSGGYSPTLERSIAFVRVPKEFDKQCFIEIRDKRLPARIIKPPFVRHGKQMF